MGTHVSNDAEHIKTVFAEIASIPCEEDGIVFDTSTINAVDITQEKEYHGLRLSVVVMLDSVRQPISMDIGFGDIVTPGPQSLDYPLLLEDVPSVNVLAYSLETVVAEKFEAMISLSVNNSRMKDFFDVYGILGEADNLDDDLLMDAILNTFRNRGTGYSENHPLFSDEFFTDAMRVARWKGFLRSIKWKEEIPFDEVGQKIQQSLLPYWKALKMG